MPKYLIQASYTGDGTKGLMKEGGSKRRATRRGQRQVGWRHARGILFCLWRIRRFHHCRPPRQCHRRSTLDGSQRQRRCQFEDSCFADPRGS